MNPVEHEPGAMEDNGEDAGEEDMAQEEEYEELAKKYEQFKTQVEQYFDGEHCENRKREVPVLKAPEKPTKKQWQEHQATHIPYAAWCKHCLAARAVRNHHPSKGRKAMVVPDVETGVEGPTKFSIDYM